MSSPTEIVVTRDAAAPCPGRIIPPEKHPITTEMIDRDALYILRKLNDAGFAGYLVGGGVRDLYLGKTPKDFDISTDARPGQLRKLFPNSNTIGRRFRLVQIFFRGGKTIEISTLRSLSEHDLDGPEAVLAPNNTFGTLSEDAQRRDLTINSLFFEIETGTIIDYVDGSVDLDRGIIRIVGEPDKRISRDPVRMMRAIRHAARIDFTIEEQTWKALCGNSHKLTLCPPSRLRDEFLKDLYSGAAAPWFELAVESGLLFSLFPCYRKILAANPAPAGNSRALLTRICRTIDRTNNLALEQKIHRQPDFFLIGLFFIPWAEARFQLLSQFRKGAALFQLSKQIREEIDQTIGIDLNLRRSLRQDMVSLLTNLSLLIHNKQQNGWPKWLKKKSYFKRAVLFYHLYMAATTDQTVDHLFLGEPRIQPAPEQVDSIGKNPAPPQCKPAFANKTKGGIFGFRK